MDPLVLRQFLDICCKIWVYYPTVVFCYAAQGMMNGRHRKMLSGYVAFALFVLLHEGLCAPGSAKDRFDADEVSKQRFCEKHGLKRDPLPVVEFANRCCSALLLTASPHEQMPLAFTLDGRRMCGFLEA